MGASLACQLAAGGRWLREGWAARLNEVLGQRGVACCRDATGRCAVVLGSAQAGPLGTTHPKAEEAGAAGPRVGHAGLRWGLDPEGAATLINRDPLFRAGRG